MARTVPGRGKGISRSAATLLPQRPEQFQELAGQSKGVGRTDSESCAEEPEDPGKSERRISALAVSSRRPQPNRQHLPRSFVRHIRAVPELRCETQQTEVHNRGN